MFIGIGGDDPRAELKFLAQIELAGNEIEVTLGFWLSRKGFAPIPLFEQFI
jgi:hypothetical protein